MGGPRDSIAPTGVILAGGLATRLRTVLPDVPKALAPVRGRPFLTILFDRLLRAGVREFLLCTGHLGSQLEAALGDSYRGCPIHYSREERSLGTAGALRLAFERYPADLWMVLNGDSYVHTELGPFLAASRESGRRASMLLAWMEDTARFGTVGLDDSGVVRRFQEKTGVAAPGWINAGVYVLSRPLLESLPDRAPLSLEREIFPTLLDGDLGGYAVRAPFLDIGTPESLAAAEAFFSALPAPPRCVVLDRDGTVIVERNYLSSPEQVELLPHAAEGLRAMREQGLLLVMITNQSGIGRGYFDRARVDAVHRRMLEMLAEKGAGIDAIYICPHVPEDDCACRKPGTALLQKAALEWGFRPEESFVIGDKACDIDLGRAAGAQTVLVLSGYGKEHLESGAARPHHVVQDLKEAARLIAAGVISS